MMRAREHPWPPDGDLLDERGFDPDLPERGLEALWRGLGWYGRPVPTPASARFTDQGLEILWRWEDGDVTYTHAVEVPTAWGRGGDANLFAVARMTEQYRCEGCGCRHIDKRGMLKECAQCGSLEIEYGYINPEDRGARLQALVTLLLDRDWPCPELGRLTLEQTADLDEETLERMQREPFSGTRSVAFAARARRGSRGGGR